MNIGDRLQNVFVTSYFIILHSNIGKDLTHLIIVKDTYLQVDDGEEGICKSSIWGQSLAISQVALEQIRHLDEWTNHLFITYGNFSANGQNTHHTGISYEQDHNDHKEARYVTPGSLQWGSDEVHLGVQSEQVPQFDGGQQDQKGNQRLEHQVCGGSLIKIGKSAQ